jgi:cytidyltransferase-like protein
MPSTTPYKMAVVACLLYGCSTTTKPSLNKPRIVYVDMVADLFHPGHIAFLKKAKEKGDYLLVGLITDEDAESYTKRKPLMNLVERTEMVRSCKYVDEVIVGSPYRLSDEFIDSHHIDLVVHGDDFSMEALYYYYQPAIDRGAFKVVEYTPGMSTSELIERVLRLSHPQK